MMDSLPVRDSDIRLEITFRRPRLNPGSLFIGYFRVSSLEEQIYGFAFEFELEYQIFDTEKAHLFTGINNNCWDGLCHTDLDYERVCMSLSSCQTNGKNVSYSNRSIIGYLKDTQELTTNRPDSILEVDIIPKNLIAINAAGKLLKVHGEKATIIIENVPYVPDTLTSVANVEAAPLFEAQLFPNPSDGKLWLQSNQPIQGLEIFDTKGQLQVQLTSLTTHLDISNQLDAGLYFVRFTDKQGRQKMQSLLIQP